MATLFFCHHHITATLSSAFPNWKCSTISHKTIIFREVSATTSEMHLPDLLKRMSENDETVS